MASSGTEVIKTFRDDHQIIRDLVLDLSRAFADCDILRARTTLAELNRVAGPHFRFEEEGMYDLLRPFYPPEYVDKLLDDHDGAIERARRLAGLLEKDTISQEEGQRARIDALGFMPHVTDCEGLTILLETLPQPDMDKIASDIDRSRNDAWPLLDWAGNYRQRSQRGTA